MRGSNGRMRTLGRLDGHGTGDVGDLGQVAGTHQGIGQEGRADLRAVDERQSFLGQRPVRFEVHAPQGSAAAERLDFWACSTGRFAIDARLRHERMAFAHDDEGQVGQRRQVAAGADAALLGNGRHHAAVVHLDQAYRSAPAVTPE